MPVRGSYDVTAMCLQATGLRFFQVCHCAELNKIVDATMPVNLYDDRKVSLLRPHGNSDLDIVRASYSRCKANVTEALGIKKRNRQKYNFCVFKWLFGEISFENFLLSIYSM